MGLVDFRYGEGCRVFFILVHLVLIVLNLIKVLIDCLTAVRHFPIGDEPILNELLIGRVFGGR